MNKEEIIKNVAEKLNLPQDTCTKVLTAFEELGGSGIADQLKSGNISGASILGKLTGAVGSSSEIVSKVAAQTGVDNNICQSIVDAVEKLVGNTVSDKLSGLFKK